MPKPILWGEVVSVFVGARSRPLSIRRIRERLQTVQSRQESYVVRWRSGLEFQVADHVMLRVSPWNGVIRFRKRGLPFRATESFGSDSQHAPLIQVDESLNCVDGPVVVLERKVKRLRDKESGTMNVQWQLRRGSKWTWEPEDGMQELYPEHFTD
ncbi:LOW QUALITY PROTEIN: hypothetical protein OSB04_017233 [Centaurea solstitialis]|uniref:Chromo domain-containing protein n=1 Tax=Centaurea solstitialis TaxID=347529 RepID=A0AA38TA35_9ASTR|nr:LOW QUALITY PROTEIN: hypothetical protein OSB04_017233 [Centaurea solstitialis]